MSEPYDPYIPSGGAGGHATDGHGQKVVTQQIHQQLDQTLGIMRDNIERTVERGVKIDSLKDKTDNLAVSSQGFRRGANKVRKQMWWKEMKMKLLIALGFLILLLIIIVPLVLKHSK